MWNHGEVAERSKMCSVWCVKDIERFLQRFMSLGSSMAQEHAVWSCSVSSPLYEIPLSVREL